METLNSFAIRCYYQIKRQAYIIQSTCKMCFLTIYNLFIDFSLLVA